MFTGNKLFGYFVVSTFILWFGPNKFLALIPGMKDSLPTVHLDQGIIRGENWKSRDGRPFAVFRSIPYAKPPVGDLRFRPPQPLDETDVWRRTRDLTWDPPQCYQINSLQGETGSEDCLYLNIYSPNMNPDKPLPVMVFIHGGGFMVLSSRSLFLGPHFFMDEDVVLVTINYRLGPLGFLNLENEEIQGNFGLWDQRLALIWIKRHIKEFGGDPNLITLFGESAGSMSVHAHLLSPRSKGLFHRAIMQSGTITSSFLKLNRNPSEYGKEFVESLGCGDSMNKLECMQDVSLSTMFSKIDMFDNCNTRKDLGLANPRVWVPSSDSFLEKPFFPKSAKELQSSGEINSVPVMIGTAEEEGLLYSTRFVKDKDYEDYFFDNLDTCGPANFFSREQSQVTEEDLQAMHDLMGKYGYLTRSRMEVVRDIMTDAVFAYDSHKTAMQLAKNNTSVFRYIMTHMGTKSHADIFARSLPQIALSSILGFFGYHDSMKLGTSHGDDLMYLFSSLPLIDQIPSEDDKFLSRNMIRWWVNFAKTGRPNKSWTPLTSEKSSEAAFWNLNANSPGMVKRPDLIERYNRWEKINL